MTGKKKEEERRENEHNGFHLSRKAGIDATKGKDQETRNKEMQKETFNQDIMPPRKRKRFRKTF